MKLEEWKRLSQSQFLIFTYIKLVKEVDLDDSYLSLCLKTWGLNLIFSLMTNRLRSFFHFWASITDSKHSFLKPITLLSSQTISGMIQATESWWKIRFFQDPNLKLDSLFNEWRLNKITDKRKISCPMKKLSLQHKLEHRNQLLWDMFPKLISNNS